MTFNKLTDKSMWLPYKKCFSYVRILNVILKSNEYNNNCNPWKTERSEGKIVVVEPYLCLLKD